MKEKRRDAWMPFYIGDYLRDTQHLNAEKHGAYVLLIFAYWVSGAPLPDDDEHLATIARVPLDRWHGIRNIIAAFFDIAHGVWRHKRVDIELRRAKRISKERSKAGAEGAAKRWQSDNNTDDKPMANAMANGMAKPSQNDAPSQSPPPKERVEAATPPDGAVKRAPKGTRLAGDFIVLMEWREEAREAREKHGKPAIDIDLEAELFTNYWLAKAGADGCKLDWHRTWINWILNSRAAALAKPANGRAPDPDETFRAMVRVFLERGTWARTHWGPAIGELGCKVPAHILAEFSEQLAARKSAA
jgi:uncharacterized protein YdaU (DUF1376 family)